MSVDSCVAFIQETQRSPELKQILKAITDTRELIALGRRRGFSFDADDIMTASSMAGDGAPAGGTSEQPSARTESRVCHYEFDLEQIPALGEAVGELANLTIKPTTVDLRQYERTFREEDLQWTSMSPAEPGFEARYQEVMAAHWHDGDPGHEFGRRDFHLVNLDHHVDDPLYDEYLQAKSRMVSVLEAFFGDELQFSGSMWYPPFSYRLWHTNETQPGWRMYLIDFDEEIAESDTSSFFRYMNPETKAIVTLRDRPKLVRLFKIEQQKDKLFWHCIVNGAPRNRWSFGFAVPETWLDKLPEMAGSTVPNPA